MTRTAQQVRQEIQQTEAKLTALTSELTRLERACSHTWGSVVYDPVHTEGYRIPSDREQGIEMGVDSRPAYDVPSQTTRRWRRACTICGKVETTTHVKKQRVAGPTPGTSAEAEIPDFGDGPSHCGGSWR